MQAIRVHHFGEPDVLQLEELPDLVPAPGQVLIETRAIGVNPVETYFRSGTYGPMSFPYTPGTDCAGVVRASGADVRDFAPGDRVYTFKTLTGAYASLALADPATVRTLPDKISFEQGASLGVPAATAYRAVFIRGRAQPGETILVHGGTGGVGTIAIQLARAAGLTVIASAGDQQGKHLVLAQGAHFAVDHAAPAQVMPLTNNRGVDLIIEPLANKNLQTDLEMLAPAGRVVVVGSRGKIEINPRDTMKREADIRGLTLFAATPAELRSIHAALLAGLENGSLRPVVGKKIPLAEAPRAHREIMNDKARGKLVLIP